jgi:energy-coupling factor transporter ATP-binding protein EcfA2
MNTQEAMLLAISGPSGAGKSTLVAKVTAVLRRATALYSHSYERVGTWHPDSRQWVEQGCDPNQWVSIPQLVEDVRALRHGRAIVLPPSPVPCPGATRCRTALCATLVLCRWNQQRTIDYSRQVIALAESSRGRCKESRQDSIPSPAPRGNC